MTDTPAETPAETAVPVLLSREIKDWRVAEGEDEELSGRQREPWQLKVEPGGWDGLHLTFTAPDGSERSVQVEIDMGNVTLNVFGSGEEALCKVHIGAEQAEVISGHFSRGHLSGVRFTDKGLEPGDAVDEPTPAFGDEAKPSI